MSHGLSNLAGWLLRYCWQDDVQHGSGEANHRTTTVRVTVLLLHKKCIKIDVIVYAIDQLM